MNTLTLTLCLLGAEIWPSLNRDGDGSNANATSLGATPTLAWSKTYSGYPLMKGDNLAMTGRRQNGLCIRNGEILMVTPERNPAQPPYTGVSVMADPLVERLSLADGSRTKSYYAPIPGGSVSYAKLTYVVIQETDLQTGLFNLYWDANNVVHGNAGGDWGWQRAFNADTGERVLKTSLNTGSNKTGYAIRHNDAPGYFIGGGGDAHNSWQQNNSRMGRDMDATVYANLSTNLVANTMYAEVMKDYGASLMNGSKAYCFVCWGYKSSEEGYGATIRGYDLAVNTWPTPDKYMAKSLGRFDDKIQSFSGYGQYHNNGAPRALCVTESGKVCYFGFTAKGTPGTPGRSNTGTLTPDANIPLALTVLSPTLTKLGNIPTTYKLPGTWYNYKAFFPQIATLGKYVVVFAPQQSACNQQARLFCFDTETNTLAWEYIYPKLQFKTNTHGVIYPGETSREQAVQMAIAGGQVLVAEPYVETTLKTRLYRHALTTGAISGEDLRFDSGIANCRPDTVALRELAVVDGSAAMLVDAKLTDGKTVQWLGVVK